MFAYRKRSSLYHEFLGRQLEWCLFQQKIRTSALPGSPFKRRQGRKPDVWVNETEESNLQAIFLWATHHSGGKLPLPDPGSINQTSKRYTTQPVPSTWSTRKVSLSTFRPHSSNIIQFLHICWMSCCIPLRYLLVDVVACSL